MGDERGEIETLRNRLQNNERNVTANDAATLLNFSDELDLRAKEYGDARHIKLLRHCTRMAEHAGPLTPTLEERAAAEDIVRWIHSEYDNEETNRDYRSAYRTFGRHASDGDEIPESIAWVDTQTSRDYDPAPNPAEMLTLDGDVKPMIETANNTRGKALIGLQYEAGLRGSELFELTIGDITDDTHGYRVHVDGKTGERSECVIDERRQVSPTSYRHSAYPFFEATARGQTRMYTTVPMYAPPRRRPRTPVHKITPNCPGNCIDAITSKLYL